MKKLVSVVILAFAFSVFAYQSAFAQVQSQTKGIMKKINESSGYYNETIMKDIKAAEAPPDSTRYYYRFQVDFTGMDLPNKVDLYKRFWANPPISQGNTGTCWDFSTTSFLESEVYRLTGQKVKLSEMYTVYWEYVEKAKRYVEQRGNSEFGQGSESNAVTRDYEKYGIVPLSVYNGNPTHQKFYDHDKMFNEMYTYLQSLKKTDDWNVDAAVSTIKAILNHYMGQPPASFTLDGKTYTPKQYLTDVLKLNMNDYIDILSYKQQPFWKQVEYQTPDNWWHSKDYYNVPVDDFIKIMKDAITNGYTMAIGGDVTEPGFDRDHQVGIIPTFDIPAQYINDDAREMRFADKSTTDDHGMHLVGYYVDKNGKWWFLIKDSSSGSRNNNPKAKEFGYYFINQDYMKLKMMDFMINKNGVSKDIMSKFK